VRCAIYVRISAEDQASKQISSLDIRTFGMHKFCQTSSALVCPGTRGYSNVTPKILFSSAAQLIRLNCYLSAVPIC